MCSILGLLNFTRKISPQEIQTLNTMGKTLIHRGPDQNGLYYGDHFAFQHNRLAIIDIEKGRQPMTASHEGYEYTIVYNGELYNTGDLRQELLKLGVKFRTYCDTEVVLYSYILWGEQCSSKLNGIYSFVIYDSKEKRAYLSRDRFGVKPFFYTFVEDALLFASEIKALLKHPQVQPQLDHQGLWQLLYMMPVKEEGTALFKGISELPTASHAFYTPTPGSPEEGLKISNYWTLEAYENRDSEDTIVETTRGLLVDAIERQLVSDVPLCSFLSGGLDSSVITAVAAQKYKTEGRQLATYSFEHEGNKDHFQQTLFQPQRDEEFALYLAQHLHTHHRTLTATKEDLVGYLNDAVNYRDYPGMADIDSSLLFYCRQVKNHHTVALSGECSDEVFGGYPWFYRPEMLTRSFFPWIHDPHARIGLFKPELVRPQEGFEYTSGIFRRSVEACPTLPGESETMRNSRIASWLSIHYFMTSLLERKDRMSMASGLEVRVPFSDHRLVQYVYNVPWEIKFKGGVEKSLLRAAMQDYLPDKILYRKKSPFPKTHDPHYEQLVFHLFRKRLGSGSGVLAELLQKDVLNRLINPENKTWFGQLMGVPQLMAWLVQLDYWFETYQVQLEL
ncbi:asparagine synthase, glutamine-hydrolyzing [Desulfitobacterium dehalogenans ATCC 51507]|uniref:asparagine synthase (glutamine-hydrolyzing) n=1 Tax=Desulfitobacterium dehalogenans (strain ATCC 51507 / DSM 9161 / JW/IU-DC1) TaxID=756499 RepID=I4A5W4_DESDJ|nr:asparagine synthase (glutamine-hydrolyzing) [Desulfitobacterium dehalogenans]AFL99348.1 asparagine synthase, glutamine-hydrolyzing [Desulfitobacterium dehalogenans ATCC 51507]